MKPNERVNFGGGVDVEVPSIVIRAACAIHRSEQCKQKEVSMVRTQNQAIMLRLDIIRRLCEIAKIAKTFWEIGKCRNCSNGLPNGFAK